MATTGGTVSAVPPVNLLSSALLDVTRQRGMSLGGIHGALHDADCVEAEQVAIGETAVLEYLTTLDSCWYDLQHEGGEAGP